MGLLVAVKPDQRKSADPARDYEGRARVLLVEDTEDNRFMMRRLLELSGFNVAEATNGAEAVRSAEFERPEIILMDLSLPILDGIAATRRIRQLPELEDVPIIAVSAHDTADFHAEALAAGCNAYVTKPIDYSDLESLITLLLTKSKSDREH
jgi:CheY-like chemotaxis protein